MVSLPTDAHRLLQQYEVALMMLFAMLSEPPGERSAEQLSARIQAVDTLRAEVLKRLEK